MANGESPSGLAGLASSPYRGAFLRGHKLKIPLDIPQTCAILVKYANEQLGYEQLEI